MASFLQTYKQFTKVINEAVTFAQMLPKLGDSFKAKALDVNKLISGTDPGSSSSSNYLFEGGLFLVIVGGGAYYAYSTIPAFKTQVDDLLNKVKSYLPSSSETDGGTDGSTS